MVVKNLANIWNTYLCIKSKVMNKKNAFIATLP